MMLNFFILGLIIFELAAILLAYTKPSNFLTLIIGGCLFLISLYILWSSSKEDILKHLKAKRKK